MIRFHTNIRYFSQITIIIFLLVNEINAQENLSVIKDWIQFSDASKFIISPYC